MRSRLVRFFFTLLLMGSAVATWAQTKADINTSEGHIIIELNDRLAPKTTANFIEYAKAGFYDGTLFHRVIKGFMIQGGGFTADMKQKNTRTPIVNESSNGLKNVTGTIAMARTDNPDSATSQFFINMADNAFLDKSASNAGYAVFGKVIEGMDVVMKIAEVPTQKSGMHADVPRKPVVIHSITITP